MGTSHRSFVGGGVLSQGICREGSSRVVRGGSWNNNARNCRSANRNRNTPDNTNNNIGFRVVLVSSRTPPYCRSYVV
ncbi:MAG: SUMF1/EgtB/PvdO family nonheme iron enzyme [bacterium]